jgi:A/G-specific adenine glycosylase
MARDFSRFKKIIWTHYAEHRRSFPWRERAREMTDDEWTYRVVISEIMLQQTQAPRVVEKFNSFMKKFPDFPALAHAPLRNVLAEWQGLGYNRRGLYLKKLAETVVEKYGGKGKNLPRDKAALTELPGIGPHTAGSILAFAWNIPEPFIETNIRTVYIHFFFKNKKAVDDRDIYSLVAQTIDTKNPREWFFALMDYGVHLKQLARETRRTHGTQDPAKRSRHYKKQSAFKGSNRELRAIILKIILEKPKNNGISVIFDDVMKKNIAAPVEAILKNLAALEREGFIQKKNGKYSIVV